MPIIRGFLGRWSENLKIIITQTMEPIFWDVNIIIGYSNSALNMKHKTKLCTWLLSSIALEMHFGKSLKTREYKRKGGIAES